MPTILLVEDNDMNLDMLKRRLERKGFEVISSRDAQGGITAAQTNVPNLILMDIGLPEMDGLEATRRLKADDRTSSIPIIALTAHAMPGDREKALKAGCDDYDSKPVDMQRLLGKIDALLNGSQAE